MASWDLTTAPRGAVVAKAKELKNSGRPGDFFIRGSVKHAQSGAFGLTVKLPAAMDHNQRDADTLANYLIEKGAGGLTVRGSEVSFPSLRELVEYFGQAKRYPLTVRLTLPGALPDASAEIGQAAATMAGLGSSFPVSPGIPHSPSGVGGAGLDYLYDDAFNFELDDEAFGFGFGAASSPGPYDQVRGSGVYSGINSGVGGGNGGDALQVDLLRKQAEVVAARRRAAELNVKLLLEHEHELDGSTVGQTEAARWKIEEETRLKMKSQMADMKNKGLLAGWMAQMEEVDQLRGTAPRAARDGAGRPDLTPGQPSVQKMYDDIGNYNDKLRMLKEEERDLEEAEAKFAMSLAISSDVELLIKSLADKAVGIGEFNAVDARLMLKDAELSMKEEEANAAAAEAEEQARYAQEQEARINEISAAMRPLAQLFGVRGGSGGGGWGNQTRFGSAQSQNISQSTSRGQEAQWWKGVSSGGAASGGATHSNVSGSNQQHQSPINRPAARKFAQPTQEDSVPAWTSVAAARRSWQTGGNGNTASAGRPGDAGDGGAGFATVKFGAARRGVSASSQPQQSSRGSMLGGDECTYLGSCQCSKCV